MGLQVVVLPKFDLEKSCRVIQDYGITYASVPPPVVLALAKHPVVSKYDLSSIKWLNSGAAPLGKDLVSSMGRSPLFCATREEPSNTMVGCANKPGQNQVEIVWQRLMIPTMQGYGLSETAPTLTKGALHDWARYNSSVGRLLPNLEVKFVLEGREVGPGEEGELWVRGPNVFPGYLNRPDLQAETFDDGDGGGFFRTGDIGYVDPKGNFYITDRLKELIKYSESSLPLASYPFPPPPLILHYVSMGKDQWGIRKE